MAIKIQLSKNTAAAAHRIILCDKDSKYAAFIPKEDAAAAKAAFDAKQPMYQILGGGQSVTIVMLDNTREPYKLKEDARRAAHGISRGLNALRATEASFENATSNKALGAAFVEGAILSSYQFLKYKTKEVKVNTLAKLIINENSVTKAELTELEATSQGTLIARELVNEPLSFLTAEQLSKEIVKIGKDAGFKV
ncbi:MAG: peptidase, partial [Bacteroidetes bacterium]|nr:peptidase [Bacteroidota bacterium]